MNINFKYTVDFEYIDGDKRSCNFFCPQEVEDWLKDAAGVLKPNWTIKPFIR